MHILLIPTAHNAINYQCGKSVHSREWTCNFYSSDTGLHIFDISIRVFATLRRSMPTAYQYLTHMPHDTRHARLRVSRTGTQYHRFDWIL